jgi:hypothetical protein
MRRILLISLVLLGGAASASAQSRFTVGPIARIDRVYIDGHTDGTSPIAGVAGGVKVSRAIAVEGELTHALRDVARSYEGQFISYVQTPDVSRAEFERFAPTARRTLTYAPGFGGAGMVVARSPLGPRIALAGRLGVSARRYDERSSYVVLAIPDGVDPARVARDFQPESIRTVRGGVLLGLDLDLALTTRLTVAPQVRLVHSGPARFGNTHRELGLGVNGRWQF